MFEYKMESIYNKISNIFGFEELNTHQKAAISNLVDQKNDMFVFLKTGAGKSLIFQFIPVLFPGTSVLVFEPLTQIMQEHVDKLRKLGFSAAFIGNGSDIDEEKFKNCGYDFIYCYPEILEDTQMREQIWKTDIWQEKLRFIVVDEAHTILSW